MGDGAEATVLSAWVTPNKPTASLRAKSAHGQQRGAPLSETSAASRILSTSHSHSSVWGSGLKGEHHMVLRPGQSGTSFRTRGPSNASVCLSVCL